MSEPSIDDAADEWRWIVSVLQRAEPLRDDVNEALTLLGGLRRDLDRVEHRLIGLARGNGSGWREIAESLGLRSRQAAEQRYLRLQSIAEPDLGSVRKRLARRREMDARAGASAARLRAAVGALIDELERGARKADGRGVMERGVIEHSAIVRLALRTLRIALEGEAGALFDLAALAISDLDGLPAQARSGGLDAAIGEVRRALGPLRAGMIEPS